MGVSDLSVKIVPTSIDRHRIFSEEEGVVDLFSEFHGVTTHGDELELPRGKPEVPLASRVLAEDSNESFERAEDGSVDDDGASEAVLDGFDLRIPLIKK